MVKAMRFRVWQLPIWLVIAGCLGGAGYMEYHVQRHGDQANFAYSVMFACLAGIVVLVGLIGILAMIRENRDAEAELEAVEE